VVGDSAPQKLPALESGIVVSMLMMGYIHGMGSTSAWFMQPARWAILWSGLPRTIGNSRFVYLNAGHLLT